MTKEERDRLIEDNVGLVYHVAYRYFGNDINYSYSFEDFIAEGIFGLIEAANNYDESKDIKFTTYACKCIRYVLLTALRNDNRKCRKSNMKVSLDQHLKTCEDLTLLDRVVIKEEYNNIKMLELLDIIDRCNIKQIKFIVVKLEQGFTTAEIAKMLGTSQPTVSRRIIQLRKRLTRLMVA